MKKKLRLFSAVCSAVILSYSIVQLGTASGEVSSNSEKLKSLLLMDMKTDNYTIYDTNSDNSVNVLDLCRRKRDILYRTHAEFQIRNAEVNYTDRTVRIPVFIENTPASVTGASMKIEYDHERFSLEQVYSAGKGRWMQSGNDMIEFYGDNGAYLTGNETAAYLQFRIKGDMQSAEHQFALSGIISSVISESGSVRKLTNDECPERSETRVYINQIITTTVPPVTQPPVTVTTAPPETTPPPVTTTQPVQEDLSELTSEEAKLIELVNQFRKEQNLQPLQPSMAISRAARERAQELGVVFSVNRPNGSDDLDPLLEKNGVYVSRYGNYFTATMTSAEDVMTKMRRATLYSFDKCKRIGVGYAYVPNSAYTHYWVLIWTT